MVGGEHTHSLRSLLPRVVQYAAVGALVYFTVNVLWVAFFGGIHVRIGETYLRATKIEFPMIGLLASILVWLLASGKVKESVLVGGSLIFSLGVGELGLRIVDHPWSKPLIDFNRWYEPSERYGHQLVKGFEGPGPLHVPVTINSLGFRDSEHVKTKEPGVVRVLGLGDSFTFGWGVPLEQTFLKQLEQMLAHRTGRAVEIFNTGVPGWGLNQYYICLKDFGLEYAPDIVVVGYWPDDLTGPPVGRMSLTPDAHWEGETGVQLRGGILHHSRMFNFLHHLADQIKYRNRSTRIPYLHDVDARRAEWTTRPQFLISDPGPEDTARYGLFLRDHLLRLKRLVTNHGASLVVVFIPDYSQLFHPEFQHINRVMKGTAEQLGIDFVDMTPIYEATEAVQPNYFWPLDGHTNETGHQAIAEALTPMMCRILMERQMPCHAAPVPRWP